MSEKYKYPKLEDTMNFAIRAEEAARKSHERRKGKTGNSKLRLAGATALSAVGFVGGAHVIGNAIDQETRPVNPESKVVHINVVDESGQASEITVGIDKASPAQVYAKAVEENNGQFPEAP